MQDVLSIDQILSAAKLPQESVPICMRADVLSEIGELERRIRVLTADDDDIRMISQHEDNAADLADRIRELEAEADRHTINLRLQGVDRRRWNVAIDNHKAEDEDSGEEKLDLNALVEELFAESLVSPEMGPAEQERFLATVTEGQWEKIVQTIWVLNRTVTTVGKSVTASQVFMRRSAKPERGER